MSLEVTRIVASKFGAQDGTTSTIFNVGPNTTVSTVITVAQGYLFFLSEYGGNVTASGVTMQVKDRFNTVLVNHTAFPDFFHIFEFYPFLKDYQEGTFSFVFTNTGSTTITVTFVVKGFIIPKVNLDDFRNALYNYYNPLQEQLIKPMEEHY